MSEAAEDQLNPDTPQEGEESKYRSYREEADQKAKAKQKFKVDRVVWLKTDSNGSFRMTVADATYNSGANSWSYKLKDSMGDDLEGWVAETKLTAANPSK